MSRRLRYLIFGVESEHNQSINSYISQHHQHMQHETQFINIRDATIRITLVPP